MEKYVKYIFAILVIVGLVVAVYAFTTYLGEPDEFKGGDLVDESINCNS